MIIKVTVVGPAVKTSSSCSNSGGGGGNTGGDKAVITKKKHTHTRTHISSVKVVTFGN